MEKLRRIRDLKITTSYVMISYARNGHLLYEGVVEEIPAHLLDYYVDYLSVNKYADKTYIECVEDTKWFAVEE